MPEIDDDLSANTARFRAFAERMDDETAPTRGGRSAKGRVILLAIGVVCLAVVVGVLATTL